jgi:hypothetical protein
MCLPNLKPGGESMSCAAGRRLLLHATLAVMAFALVGTGLRCRALRAAGTNPPPRAEKHLDPDKGPPWEILGRGVTQDIAERRVLAEAKELVDDYLRRQTPSLEWSPSLAYIRKHLVKGAPQRRQEDDQVVDREAGPVKCWAYTVNVTAGDLADMKSLDRHERAGQRMLLLFKVLGGLVAFLTAVAGYIRLEERTKGYYTAWLRLAAAGFVGAVGLGLWLLS